MSKCFTYNKTSQTIGDLHTFIQNAECLPKEQSVPIFKSSSDSPGVRTHGILHEKTALYQLQLCSCEKINPETIRVFYFLIQQIFIIFGINFIIFTYLLRFLFIDFLQFTNFAIIANITINIIRQTPVSTPIVNTAVTGSTKYKYLIKY